MNFIRRAATDASVSSAAGANLVLEVSALAERVEMLERVVRLLIFDLVQRQGVQLLPELQSEGEKL